MCGLLLPAINVGGRLSWNCLLLCVLLCIPSRGVAKVRDICPLLFSSVTSPAFFFSFPKAMQTGSRVYISWSAFLTFCFICLFWLWFLFFYRVCYWGGERCWCSGVCMWKSEDNFVECILSFTLQRLEGIEPKSSSLCRSGLPPLQGHLLVPHCLSCDNSEGERNPEYWVNRNLSEEKNILAVYF